MDRLFNVGAYVRLSVESASYESDSVENQCSMLSKFIGMMPGWVEQKFYVDDGFSGANFQRPAFGEMIEDVRRGSVNLVLVKDLSRFGRNYLEAGHYLEETLPALGCRFVSLTEGIDTENGENDIMPFLNAMNDYYVKNHSDRIRSIMAAKAKDGQKISGHAPYGFRRSPENNTRLVIDAYSAEIVRRIFSMRRQGMGFYSIAKTLNTDGVLSPMLYYLNTIDRDDSHVKARSWRPSFICELVKNELYIGNAVQLEKKIVSYRDKREVSRPSDEQIRVDGAFPAIIDIETWVAVQAINKQAGKLVENKREPEKRMFTGIAVCADCGAKLVSIKDNRVSKKQGTGYVSYLCGKYHSSGGAECTRHSASQNPLSEIVLEKIRLLVEQVRLDEEAVINALSERLIGDRNVSRVQKKKESAALKLRIHKLEVSTAQFYEARLSGEISEAAFSELIRKNEAERLDSQKRLNLLETSEQEAAAKSEDIQNWIRLMKDNAAANEMNRDLLESLVEKIEIGEGKIVNGVKEQEIRIHYKFVGIM